MLKSNCCNAPLEPDTTEEGKYYNRCSKCKTGLPLSKAKRESQKVKEPEKKK